MTTKQQERDAISRIREILETLDADGYVRTAFDGVLEIAETNIENDWACSLKERLDSAIAENARLRAANSDLSDTLQIGKARITELEEQLEGAEATRKDLSALYDELVDKSFETERELRESLQETKLNLDAANREIIELKAKLYDYIVKEG